MDAWKKVKRKMYVDNLINLKYTKFKIHTYTKTHIVLTLSKIRTKPSSEFFPQVSPELVERKRGRRRKLFQRGMRGKLFQMSVKTVRFIIKVSECGLARSEIRVGNHCSSITNEVLRP